MRPQNNFTQYLRSLDLNQDAAGPLLTAALGYARSIGEIDDIVIRFLPYLKPQHKIEILDAILRRRSNDDSLINKIRKELR